MFDKFLILITSVLAVANSIIMIEYREELTTVVPPAYYINFAFNLVFFITALFLLKKAWKYRVRSPIWKQHRH